MVWVETMDEKKSLVPASETSATCSRIMQSLLKLHAAVERQSKEQAHNECTLSEIDLQKTVTNNAGRHCASI